MKDRKFYKTLFLFRKKKTCAKRKKMEMNGKAYIVGKRSSLHSSLHCLSGKKRRGR